MVCNLVSRCSAFKKSPAAIACRSGPSSSPVRQINPSLNSGNSFQKTLLSFFGDRSLAREIRRQRFWYPCRDCTSTGKITPSSIVSSLPTNGRIPVSLAAAYNRGAPNTPSRSQSARAGSPSSAAVNAKCSGEELPRRKLNALRA